MIVISLIGIYNDKRAQNIKNEKKKSQYMLSLTNYIWKLPDTKYPTSATANIPSDTVKK